MGVPAADKLRLKDPAQFRYIGKEGTNIVDGFDITTGRAKYGQDVRLPGRNTPSSPARRSWAAKSRPSTLRKR